MKKNNITKCCDNVNRFINRVGYLLFKTNKLNSYLNTEELKTILNDMLEIYAYVEKQEKEN